MVAHGARYKVRTPEELAYRNAVRDFLALKRRIDAENTNNFKKMPKKGETIPGLRTKGQLAEIQEVARHIQSLRPKELTASEDQAILVEAMALLYEIRGKDVSDKFKQAAGHFHT